MDDGLLSVGPVGSPGNPGARSGSDAACAAVAAPRTRAQVTARMERERGHVLAGRTRMATPLQAESSTCPPVLRDESGFSQVIGDAYVPFRPVRVVRITFCAGCDHDP